MDAVISIKSANSADVFMIDECDRNLLTTKYPWRVASNGYGVRSLGGSKNLELLHHAVLGKPARPLVVDHINGDKLDNRRANLRVVTQSINAHNAPSPKNNTSGAKGVCWDAARGKWVARIKINYRNRHLGRFDTFDDAVCARRDAERRLLK